MIEKRRHGFYWYSLSIFRQSNVCSAVFLIWFLLIARKCVFEKDSAHMVDFQGEWSVKSVSKRRTFITLFPSITLVPRVELCLWRKTLFLPLFFTLLKKFFLGCAFTGGHKDLMELGDCFYNLTVFFSLQCCAHHMNLCTSRESLLWSDFVRMTWKSFIATVRLKSS